jgi:TonB family protein
MTRMRWSCVALVLCVMASGRRPVIAQGATTCDSPCKVTHLPLVGPRGTACDSPCKLQHMPLVQGNEQPVPNTNPLRELQRNVQAANGAAYFEYQVDKPAKLAPGSLEPAYPDSLRVKGVEGEIVASFIVDTTGRAEAASFRVLKPGYPLFVAAVRNALPMMRFTPAELAGVKVRQLVQRPFVFSLPH